MSDDMELSPRRRMDDLSAAIDQAQAPLWDAIRRLQETVYGDPQREIVGLARRLNQLDGKLNTVSEQIKELVNQDKLRLGMLRAIAGTLALTSGGVLGVLAKLFGVFH